MSTLNLIFLSLIAATILLPFFVMAWESFSDYIGSKVFRFFY